MKAAVWTAYGPPDVIQLGEIPTPEPGKGEVRVKIEATTVTAGDTEMRSLKFPWYLGLPIRIYAGWRKPKRMLVLGQEYAGVVDKLGDDVSEFNVGDKIFASGTMPRLGGHAEYTIAPAIPTDGLMALRPDALNPEEAAAIPFAAFEAYFFLNKAKLRSGERILIVGAGGSIGTYAVQIAKAWGAEVTAVDRAPKHATLSEIGADEVLDPAANWGKSKFDVVLDVVGIGTYGRAIQSLRRGGRYTSSNPRFLLLFRAPWARFVSGKRVIVGAANHKPEAISAITALIESGKVKPVIGRRFTLDEIVDAHRYAESGDKIGNTIVIVDQANGGAR